MNPASLCVCVCVCLSAVWCGWWQHAALTLKFEKAIQAVDPSVSVPYWDYTIDGHLITDSYDGQFSRHWFDLDVRMGLHA